LLQDEVTSILNNIEKLGYEGTGLIFGDKLMISDNHLGVNDDNQLEIKNIPYETLSIPLTEGYLNYKTTGWEVSDSIGDTNILIQETSNLIPGYTNEEILNTSNYVIDTSNIFLTHTNEETLNTSNYVIDTSNILLTHTNLKILNTSNYVVDTSNNL